MFAVLRQRNFALLWLGQLISMMGDWVLLVALPFYVYQRTGSSLATGAMFVLETLPRLFLGSVAGVFVDRWDRKQTMITTDLARALILLPLLLVHTRDLLWLVYVVAFVESTVSQFFSPAFGALIPHLVEEQQLMAANSLNALGEELTRLVGPTLGGALLALLGLNSVILADSVSYVFSGVMILLIILPAAATRVHPKTAHTTGATPTNLVQEWLQGLRLMRKSRVIATLFLVVGISMIGEGAGRAIFVPFLSGVAGGSALVFSWILTAQGVGGVVGSLALSRISKIIRPFHLVAFGGIAAGLISIVEVTFPVLPVVFVGTILIGAPVVFFFTCAYTLLQQSVADQFRGRIFGAYFNNNTLLLLVGMGVSSVLGDHIGIRQTMYLSGLFYFLAGLVALLLLRGARPR
jgi:predicted MFS family arabinose efflux permease